MYVDPHVRYGSPYVRIFGRRLSEARVLETNLPEPRICARPTTRKKRLVYWPLRYRASRIPSKGLEHSTLPRQLDKFGFELRV